MQLIKRLKQGVAKQLSDILPAHIYRDSDTTVRGPDWRRLLFNSTRDITSTLDPYQAVQGYKDVVYSCVNVRSDAVAKPKLRAWIKVGEKEYISWKDISEDQRDHPYTDAMEYLPDGFTQYSWKKRQMIDLDLSQSFHEKIRDKVTGDVISYKPLHSQYMTIEHDIYKRPTIYRYSYEGNITNYQPEEIMHVVTPNPFCNFQGYSTLMALTKSYILDNQMTDFSINFFKNNARPDLVLEFKKRLEKGDKANIESNWRRKYGGIEKAGVPAIIEQELAAIHQLSKSQDELSFTESKRLAERRIMRGFGVPPPLLGDASDSNVAANNDVLMRGFQKNTIKPILVWLQERHTMQALQDFPLTEMSVQKLFPGGEFVLLYDDNVPEDFEQTLEERKLQLQEVEKGALLINEYRDQYYESLQPLEHGNKPYNPNTALVQSIADE